MEDLYGIQTRRQEVRENIEKAFTSGINMNEELEKARSGIYADTAENRKLGRVGQKYGGKKQVEQTKGKIQKKKVDSDKLTLEEKSEITEKVNKFIRKHYEGSVALERTDEGKQLISELKKYGSEKVGKFMKRKFETTSSEGRSNWFYDLGEMVMGKDAWEKLYISENTEENKSKKENGKKNFMKMKETELNSIADDENADVENRKEAALELSRRGASGYKWFNKKNYDADSKKLDDEFQKKYGDKFNVKFFKNSDNFVSSLSHNRMAREPFDIIIDYINDANMNNHFRFINGVEKNIVTRVLNHAIKRGNFTDYEKKKLKFLKENFDSIVQKVKDKFSNED